MGQIPRRIDPKASLPLSCVERQNGPEIEPASRPFNSGRHTRTAWLQGSYAHRIRTQIGKIRPAGPSQCCAGSVARLAAECRRRAAGIEAHASESRIMRRRRRSRLDDFLRARTRREARGGGRQANFVRDQPGFRFGVGGAGCR